VRAIILFKTKENSLWLKHNNHNKINIYETHIFFPDLAYKIDFLNIFDIFAIFTLSAKATYRLKATFPEKLFEF